MCTTTTLGTQKSGRCSKGVRYEQGVPLNCYQFWKLGIRLVVVDK